MKTLFEHACDSCTREHKTTACRKALKVELGTRYTINCSKYQGEDEANIRLMPSSEDILVMSSIILTMFNDTMLPHRVQGDERTPMITKHDVQAYLKRRAEDIGKEPIPINAISKAPENKNNEIKKPPIGLRPLNIAVGAFHRERVAEIMSAIERYTEASYVIPKEWVDELNGYLHLLLTEGL